MVLKGTIQAGHIPVNNFELIVVGLPPFIVTTVSGFSDETEAIDLPDRTKASGGNQLPIELTITTPEHHTAERAALELWLREGRDPVTVTYKKIGTLIKRNIHGEIAATQSMTGLWVSKKETPELDMANEGEQSVLTWTLMADSVQPI